MSATERYGFDLEGDLARAAQELDAAFAGAWAPRIKAMVQSTRTYAYFGGPELQLDGSIEWFVDGTIVCPDDTLSLVQREPITGTVIVADPPVLQDGYRPMAVVRCTGGLLLRFVDARDAVLGKGARFLDDLEDVSLYDVADGDILKYDLGLGLWVNVPDSGGGAAGGDLQGTYPNPTLRDGAATSVIGRSANSTGPVADIAAASNNTVLGRIANVLGFIPISQSPVGGGYPAGPLPDPANAQIFVDATDVGGVTDGNPITTWPDQSPNGLDLSNGGGTDRPIYRATDSEDGLPFVEFDGVDDFFERTGMTNYTGTELTFYSVFRYGHIGAANKGLFTLKKSAFGDNNQADAFVVIAPEPGNTINLTRASVSYGVTATGDPSANLIFAHHTWAIFAGRYKVVQPNYPRAVLHLWLNNLHVAHDLGATTLTAFAIVRATLGARNAAGGAADNFGRVDMRHWSYRHGADSIQTMRDKIRLLAQTWAVPILD